MAYYAFVTFPPVNKRTSVFWYRSGANISTWKSAAPSFQSHRSKWARYRAISEYPVWQLQFCLNPVTLLKIK